MATELNTIFFIYVAATSVITSSILFYCYFGNIVTAKYSQVAVAAYASDWYAYPIRLRLYILLIMAYAQRPADVSAYTIIRLNLQTFSKVNKPRWTSTGSFTENQCNPFGFVCSTQTRAFRLVCSFGDWCLSECNVHHNWLKQND